jgi:hypothetical protein
VSRGKSASYWQPVVDGDGPNYDDLSTRALTKMAAEAVNRLWLSASPLACCAGGVVAEVGKSWLARRA